MTEHCNCNSMRSDVVLKVSGMACDHCKKTVEEGLEGIDGVMRVLANVDEGKVEVSFDHTKIQIDKIKAAIEDLGYDVQK